MEKHTTGTTAEGIGQQKPIRENKPNSIGDGLKETDKEGYPFPSKKDKQYDNQPEFIDAKSNESTNQ